MDMKDLPKRADITLLRKWYTALRSGKFKQCREKLTSEGKYCCLGVLGRVAGIAQTELEGHGYLSATNMKLAPTNALLLTADQQHKFTEMNDSKGMSFKEIAVEVKKMITARVKRRKS